MTHRQCEYKQSQTAVGIDKVLATNHDPSCYIFQMGRKKKKKKKKKWEGILLVFSCVCKIPSGKFGIIIYCGDESS